MSQLSRKEYLAKMRWHYVQRGREGKSRLLDEFCEISGYDRKHAIKLLNGKPAASKTKAGRKPVYAKEVVAVIARTEPRLGARRPKRNDNDPVSAHSRVRPRTPRHAPLWCPA